MNYHEFPFTVSEQALAAQRHQCNSATYVKNACCGSSAVEKLGKGASLQMEASNKTRSLVLPWVVLLHIETAVGPWQWNGRSLRGLGKSDKFSGL